MNFTIFNLNDGSQMTCDLAELSQSLSFNCEIVRINGDHCEAVGFVSHKTLVSFCVEWADYALQNYSKQAIVEAEECISLVKKWIEDSNSVSNKQLKSAADAAVYAAYAACATDAAAYAAYAAYAACAADAAANAAARAAYAAAYAAACAAARKNELERQGNFILKHFGVL